MTVTLPVTGETLAADLYKRLMTVNDLADYCSVSVKAVRAWVYYKKVPYLKVGGSVRFDPATIDLWIRGGAAAEIGE